MPFLQKMMPNDDIVNMNRTPPSNLPESVFFLKLNLGKSGKTIELGYPSVDKIDLNGRAIDELFQEIVDGDTDINWRKPKENTRKKLTPLSIKNNKDRYIVIALDAKTNWQFSSKHAPFKVVDGKEDIYRCACRVHIDNNTVEIVDDENRDLDNCKFAYFIAKGSDESGTNFSSAFNIYVDVYFVDDFGQKQLIPIVIDPDVGHPGGTGDD